MFLPVAALQRAGRLAHCLHDIDGLTGFADYLLPQLTAPIGCDSVTYNHVGRTFEPRPPTRKPPCSTGRRTVQRSPPASSARLVGV